MNNKIFLQSYIILTLLLLIVGGGNAFATEYVFKTSDGSKYVCINSEGNLDVTETFDYKTCIWSGTSGSGKFTCNNKTLGCNVNDGEYKPAAGGTSYTTITIYTNNSKNYVTYKNGSTYYYYKYNSTDGFTCTTGTTDAITAIAVLQNKLDLSVTLSPNQSYITSVGNTLTFTANASGSAYYLVDEKYYDLGWNGPYGAAPTVTYAYSYSLSSNPYASLSGNVITYKTDPGADVDVTLTVKTYPTGHSSVYKSVTKIITLRTANLQAPTISRVGNTNRYQIVGLASSTIKYSTDGTDIDASASNGTTYASAFTVTTAPTIIKARATRDGNVSPQAVYTVSTIIDNPTGISDNVVTLNDLEDHTWTYYKGVDESVDGGNYNDKYKGLIYSPNPRNVTIEYDGNGGAVSIEESQTKFIYYKTLEQSTTEGEYDYQVISNPFSKRPAGMGFKGWLIKEGGEYIKGYSNGDVLSLDEEIVFNNLSTGYTANCMSAIIKFEAQWTTDIQRTEITTTGSQTISFTGGNYESNFVVMKASVTGTLTVSSPCTIMMVEPDGTADYRNTYKFSGTLSPNNTGVTKMEWTNWQSSKNICANIHNLTLGRGLPSSSQCAVTITGINANCTDPQYAIKVESGKYNAFYMYSNVSSYTVSGENANAKIVIGNDYDRANSNNSNLQFVSQVCGGPYMKFSCRYDEHTIDGIVKSGTITPGLFIEKATSKSEGLTFSDYTKCFYWGNWSGNYPMGRRNVLIEGGEMCTLAGGVTSSNTTHEKDFPIFCLRIKGGKIHGSIYGTCANYTATGDVVMAITGGDIIGWICSGTNGTSNAGGQTKGKSFEYIGGNTKVYSHDGKQVIGAESIGGYVYGAGSGRSDSSTSGELTYGTNVVIADKANIERNVFAGGNYGYSAADSKIYVTGGTVGGAVFGGSNLQKGASVDIYMTGGTVKDGIYGGSNSKGTMSGNTNIKLIGGTVGTTDANANVHGGGYGASTIVTGNVDVTVGGTATVYGNVYGGSALGKTNNANTASSKTKTTNVTMTGGTINGSLFGGGLGSTAAVTTNPVVTMSGGTVTQNVFGGGDAAKVDGNTSVTITGPSHVGNNVYGGGNAAEVTGTTHVQIGEPKK